MHARSGVHAPELTHLVCVTLRVSPAGCAQIEGLKHELDFEVPKGFVWDGEMRVGECVSAQRLCAGWRDVYG